MATETSPSETLLRWDEADEQPRAARKRRYLSSTKLLFGIVMLAIMAVAAYGLRAEFLSGDAPLDNQLTQKVDRRDLLITVTANGNVDSSSNVDIKCEVAGGSTILWLIKDGTQVTQGDELCRLDGSTIEDQISQQKILQERAHAAVIEAEKNLSAAKIAVQEYLEGTYVQELQTADANIKIAMENLRSAENTYQHTERMARKGYVTGLQREAQAFAVERSKLDLATAKTARMVLEKFTRPKMHEELASKRDTAEAKKSAEEAAYDLEDGRLKRLQLQLEKCTIVAPQPGMVIYANEAGGRPGQQTVQIEEGAAVRERQSIIRLPDLNHMQVKVTVHESKVDQLHIGMRARVRVQDREFQGEISSVANQPEPGGWFSSNVKEYATIVHIDGESSGLRPGMTAVVEILIAELPNVIAVPVAAVVEHGNQNFCWVRTASGLQRRPVVLGLANSTHVEVKDGLAEGDELILNPRAVVVESREEVKTEETVDVKQRFGDAKPQPTADGAKTDSPRGAREKGENKGRRGPPAFGDLDTNSDGKITREEMPERMQNFFDNIDTNHDGAVDRKEHAAMVKRVREMQGGGGPPGGGAPAGP